MTDTKNTMVALFCGKKYPRTRIMMTAITLQNMGNYKYIYLSESKWDRNLKYSVNKKRRIGKIDQISGKAIFSATFLEDLSDSPELLKKIQTRFPSADLSRTYDNSKIKPIGRYPGDTVNYGVSYFLYNLAGLIGVLTPLKECFPDNWETIFTMAAFLIFENKTIMECDDFIEENVTFPLKDVSSQKSHELFLRIDYEKYNDFFNMWSGYIKEQTYFAFDATAAISKNIELVDFGKAKSDTELQELNLCLLYGEKSRLPIYQTIYSGSLNDVSTIQSVLNEFEAKVSSSDILLVTDKGFCSKKNIKELLTKTKVRFLSPVQPHDKYATKIVDKIISGNIMELTESIIHTNHDIIRGTTLLTPWDDSYKLYTHIYVDCMKSLQADNHLKEDMKVLRDLYLDNKLPKKDLEMFNRFLIVDHNKSKKSKYHIRDNVEEIQKFLKHVGYLVLISNHIKNAQVAYDLYANKDCAEKAYKEYKQNLGMHHIFTERSGRFTNKSIVAFIALILNSHIHRVLSDTLLHKQYTCSKMLRQIARLQAFLDSDNRYYPKPITKKQKEILEAFHVEIPNKNILNYFIKNKLKYFGD
ncbi:MAG: transposase [Deltaproteobacteria bacterium]|jgi:transposase|nr:transposase [Deltaproteobacteria bacterium]